MNGGMSSSATRQPLSTPKARPTASAAASASADEPVATTVMASAIEARVSTAPIERSRPSVMMISVIGSASSSRMVDWIRMFCAFDSVAKFGLATPKAAVSSTSAIATPGTRRIVLGGGGHWCIPRRTILASVSWSRASSPAIRPARIT